MRSSILIPVLLGAGAIAHPHFKLNNPLAHVHHKRQQPAEVLTTTVGGEVEIEDVYISTVYGNSAPSPVAAPEKLAVAPVQAAGNNYPKQQENNYPVPVQASVTPTTTPVPTQTPTTSAAPAPVTTSAAPVQSASASNDGAPVSGGKSILDSANHYRSLMGFPAFTYSSTLGANSAKTNNDDGANTMTHELNPGSMAQCIGEVDNNTGTGSITPFELIYLAWLCEIPDSRLGDDCASMLTATNEQINYSDPGHAQILRNPQYSQMGCNYLTSTQQHADWAGMWTCDFA